MLRAESMPALESPLCCVDVVKRFNKSSRLFADDNVLNGITLDLAPGSILGLIGRSGDLDLDLAMLSQLACLGV